ncbi:MAG TPA: diguanylate cyclase [Candidatus Limnocylindrales bacterium]|jgi:GGDEF domain-containing protein
MPSRDTILLIVFIGIIVNFLLACGLLVVPRLRERRRLRSIMSGTGGGAAIGRSSAHSPGRVSPAALDPETGLDLAPAWARWLADEDSRVRRYGRRATIVLVTVEGLDVLAEHLGVPAATPLTPVVANLRQHARESDRLARLGPAKFGVLLPETDEIRAINYVERVRAACDQWLESGNAALRLSIGWAEVNEGRGMHAAIEIAEDRLVVERRRDPYVEDVRAAVAPTQTRAWTA